MRFKIIRRLLTVFMILTALAMGAFVYYVAKLTKPHETTTYQKETFQFDWIEKPRTDWPLKQDLELIQGVNDSVSIPALPKAGPDNGSSPGSSPSPEEIMDMLDSGDSRLTDGYLKQLWETNEPVRQVITTLAAKAPDSTERSADIPEYYWVEGSAPHPVTRTTIKLMVVLGEYALRTGDIEFAVMADMAGIRAARALAVGERGFPTLLEVLLQRSIVDFTNRLAAHIYLQGVPEDTTIPALEKGLINRSASVDLFYRFDECIQADAALNRTMSRMLKEEYPVTMGILNAWYGDPLVPINKLSEVIKEAKTAGYGQQLGIVRGFQKAVREHRGKTLPLPAPFNKHPLLGVAVPTFSLIVPELARTDIEYRLITLGGTARLFQRKHKRRPDIFSDTEFTQQAGSCAVDPMENSPMLSKYSEDGSIVLYSLGINGQDDSGDPQKDIVVNVSFSAAQPVIED